MVKGQTDWLINILASHWIIFSLNVSFFLRAAMPSSVYRPHFLIGCAGFRSPDKNWVCNVPSRWAGLALRLPPLACHANCKSSSWHCWGNLGYTKMGGNCSFCKWWSQALTNFLNFLSKYSKQWHFSGLETDFFFFFGLPNPNGFYKRWVNTFYCWSWSTVVSIRENYCDPLEEAW